LHIHAPTAAAIAAIVAATTAGTGTQTTEVIQKVGDVLELTGSF